MCRLEEVTKFLPDPSLSISDQLSQALDVIRDQSKITADLKGHNKVGCDEARSGAKQ